MMDPKIARALRAARMGYNNGGSADPYAQINQNVQEIFNRPRRSFQQSAQPQQFQGRQEDFGVPSWVNTQEVLRRQQAAAAAANPQPAAPQQRSEYQDLASLLRDRLPGQAWAQNVANHPNYGIVNGVFQTFRPMFQGMGLDRILQGISRR